MNHEIRRGIALPKTIFCFILAVLFTFHYAGSHARAASAEKKTPIGEKIQIKPGPSYQIPENTTFPFRFQYSPGGKGLPPGSYFEIIMPQNSPLAKKAPGRPALSIRTRKYPPGVYLKIDPFYSSLTARTPGCGEKISVILEKGMEAGESFVFEIPITVMYSLHNHYNPVVTTKVDIKLHAGDGSPPRMIKTPDWRIVPQKMKRLLVSCPSQADPGEKIPVAIYFSGLFGRSVREDMGKIWIEDMAGMNVFPSQPVEILKKDGGLKTLDVSFSQPGVYRMAVQSDAGLNALGNPVMVGPKKWENIYWGNLHSHTNYSWDQRNWLWSNQYPQEMIAEARECYLLDFIAITDHGQHNVLIKGLQLADPGMPSGDMTLADWERYHREILENKRKDIIAYVGYEHRDRRGDTVMIYRNKAPYFNMNGRRMTLEQVWARSAPGSLLSIPHLHPQRGIDLFRLSSPHETLVEISSGHGSFEHYQCRQPGMAFLNDKLKISDFTKHLSPKGPFVRDILDFGKRFGIVASEDHGYPGNMAITGLFSPEKSRDAIFDSLLAAKTFGTTGTRMIIYLNGDGLLMGNEMVVEKGHPVRSSRRFHMEIHGTDKIQSVEIIRNGKIINRDDVDALDYDRTFVDQDDLDKISVLRPADQKRTTYYYLRVIQQDGHLGWSSPIFYILPETNPN